MAKIGEKTAKNGYLWRKNRVKKGVLCVVLGGFGCGWKAKKGMEGVKYLRERERQAAFCSLSGL